MSSETVSSQYHPIDGWELPLRLALASSIFLVLSQLVNPLFLISIIVALALATLAYLRPFTGFLYYLFAIQVIDFFKRLLLVFGDPSSVEWFGTLLLPDLILFGAVAGVLVTNENLRIPRSPKWRAVTWALGLFAVWYSLRTVWTGASLVNSIGKWKLVVPYFACFYLGERLITNKDALRSVLKILAATVGVAALYGIWQLFFGLTGFEERWLYGGYTSLTLGTMLYGNGLSRAFSFYSDPVTFSQMLGCIAPVLLFSRRLFGKHWWNSWLLVGVLGMAMVATVVRSGWFLCAVGILCWFWTHPNIRAGWKATVLIVVGSGIGVASWWAVSSLVDIDNPLLARAVVTGTYGPRLEGYENLLDKGIAGFVIGDGVAAMSASVRNIAEAGESTGPSLDAPADELIGHDYATETLYELGWIGFGLILFIIVRTLIGPAPMSWGGFGPALKFIVFGVPLTAVLFGGSAMEVRPLTTLVWMSAGMICATGVREAPRP